MPTIFLTGTDTGVGKTFVTAALLRALRERNMSCCGYKPVASGCELTPQGLRNEDALALQAAADTTEPYAQINPYAFAPAIAPHLAAAQAGVTVDLSVLDAAHERLAAKYEWVLMEGAGGWQVPLNECDSFADWVAARKWPVLLVVGMRLGCINHALLSAQSIARTNRLAGWVANVLPPEMPAFQGNLETLKARMPGPLLGLMRAAADAKTIAQALLG